MTNDDALSPLTEPSRREVIGWLGSAALATALPMSAFDGPRPLRSEGGITEQSDAEMRWLRDAKFGMFIHWGLYAGPGRGEWVMHNEAIPPERYRRYASPESGEEYFAADAYDPGAWADLAKAAGMRWICLTTRHHDGYSLFDNPHPNAFTSIQTHGRDFVAEYVRACRKAGLKVGVYFSPIDWRYPGYYDVTGTDCKKNPFGYRTDPAHRANARLWKEENYVAVHKLLTGYGRIDHIFWDGGWLAEQGSDADGAFFHEPCKFMDLANPWTVGTAYLDRDPKTGKTLGIMGMTRRHQPHALANPRYGCLGDYLDEEGSGVIKGPVRRPKTYQKCMTTAGAWGYDRSAVERGAVISPERIVVFLVDCVVRDMVLLLNVGPDRHGRIPPPVAASLREAGEWIRSVGEAIYGTRGGPFDPVDGKVGYCYRGDTLYVHRMRGASGPSVVVPALKGRRAKRAYDVATGRALTWREQAGEVVVEGIETTEMGSVVAVVYDGRVGK